MTTHTDLHPVAQTYLDGLRDAARTLPPDQAAELVGDIAEHLREALSGGAGEAEVRTVLDRLGTPQELVAAAGGSAIAAPDASRPGGRETLALVLLVAAELLFVVWFVAIPMWIGGLVLLAISAAWTGREKLLGLLALGTGLPAVFVTMSSVAFVTFESCTGTGEQSAAATDDAVTTSVATACTSTGGGSSWLSVAAAVLLLAYLAFQVWTVWRLTRRR